MRALLLLLLAPLISAEQLYAEWVQSGDTFTFESEPYTASYSTSQEKLYWQTPDGNFLLDLLDCRKLNTRDYCFEQLDTDERATYSNGVMYPALYLSINDIQPQITVTRGFTTDEPDYGEDVEMTVTITNNGELVAHDFSYEMIIPPNWIVLSTNAEEVGNKIIYEDNSILGYGSESFTVKLRSNVFGNTTFLGTYEYTFQGNQFTDTVDKEVIEVKKPYELTYTFSPEKIKRNQEGNLTITIKNTHSEHPVDISSLLLTVPNGIAITKTKNIVRNGKQLTFTDQIAKNSEKTLEATLKLEREGTFSLLGEAELLFQGVIFTELFNSTIGSALPNILPTITIDDSNLEDTGIIKIKATLKNTGEALGNVTVHVSSNLLAAIPPEKYNLPEGQTKTVYEKSLWLKPVTEATTHNFSVSGTYNYEGTTLSYFHKETYFQEASEKLVAITTDAPNRAAAGEEVTVTVTIENIGSSPIETLDIVDNLPASIEVQQGSFLTTIATLASGEQKEAYSYTFTIPSDYDQESLTLTTLLTAESQERLITMEQQHVIHLIEETQAPVPEPTPELNETTAPEETPGLFSRIIQWFKNLFAKEEPPVQRAEDDSDLAKRYAEQ